MHDLNAALCCALLRAPVLRKLLRSASAAHLQRLDAVQEEIIAQALDPTHGVDDHAR